MDLLAHMTTFARIAEAESLSGAARALHLSLATVSRQLKSLEDELGVVLVTRTTRKLALTAAGSAFYERCLRVQSELDGALRVARGEDAVTTGEVVVSTPVTLGLLVLGPRLPEFQSSEPGIALELRVEDRLTDLVREGVDVAVRVTPTRHAGVDLVARRVASWWPVVVAAPHYLDARGRPTSPAALAKHTLLAHVAQSHDRLAWTLESARGSTRVPVSSHLRSNSIQLLAQLARDGAGVALVPEFLVRADLDAGTLTRVLPAWRGPTVHAHLVHRRGPSSRVRRTLTWLERCLAQLARAPTSTRRPASTTAPAAKN